MKPSIPEGLRDFGPEQVAKRNYLFEVLRKIFIRYGFRPIETPTMEKLSTLTGKYGEEGDRLIFKVLNNGDFLSKADPIHLENKNSTKLISSISERGLRYDLTVPFARYVVMHQNEISFPFKRYQIQPVWRADRPQKGRYREFYQCDVDVVGSSSLMYEAELVQIYDEVFKELGLNVVILINNRKILEGIAEVAGCSDKMIDMTVAIDKLDKIGREGVHKEMLERGISETAVSKIESILDKGDLESLKTNLSSSEVGTKGIAEIESVQQFLSFSTLNNTLQFDLTLARGLNYYTGCIFEVVVDLDKHPGVKMGSIGGGGRYDNLTGVFGLPGVSGVGVSFGAERVYDVMEELGLFPDEDKEQIKVLFVSFDEASHLYAFQCVHVLRLAGVNADIYPEPVKMQKQMKYADARNVPFVAIIGEEERLQDQIAIKNMVSGFQEKVKSADLVSYFSASKG